MLGHQLTELKFNARAAFGATAGLRPLGGDGLPQFRDWLREAMDAYETAGGTLPLRVDPDDGDSIRTVRKKMELSLTGASPPIP